MNLKEIHIGELIGSVVQELQIPASKIAEFMGCEELNIEKIYKRTSIDTQSLLKWSTFLQYDFFRVYTGHLILYAPPSKSNNSLAEKNTSPVFRKNIYTQEIKDFILEKILNNQMTIGEVINRYKIPKSTLQKWITKSQNFS